MLIPLTLFLLTASLDEPVPYAASLGRPLAWDRAGMYALDVEGPLPPEDAKIVREVQAGELARAEALARARLKRDGDDAFPAWILGQIFRVKRTALAEYHRNVEGKINDPATPSVLLYRLHVCRVAQAQAVRPGPEFELRQRLSGELEALRDRCRPYANENLGVAIGITQVDPFWALTNRAVMEAYRTAHPKGVDVRPLICQAYNSGIGHGYAVSADGHKEWIVHEDEPKPKKALEIALSILKDRPNDPLGHFQAGVSYARMNLPSTATKEMRAALATGKLPLYYEAAAQRYVDTQNPNAFLPTMPY